MATNNKIFREGGDDVVEHWQKLWTSADKLADDLKGTQDAQTIARIKTRLASSHRQQVQELTYQRATSKKPPLLEHRLCREVLSTYQELRELPANQVARKGKELQSGITNEFLRSQPSLRALLVKRKQQAQQVTVLPAPKAPEQPPQPVHHQQQVKRQRVENDQPRRAFNNRREQAPTHSRSHPAKKEQPKSAFMTAGDKLAIEDSKNGRAPRQKGPSNQTNGTSRLGGTGKRSGVRSNFVCPVRKEDEAEEAPPDANGEEQPQYKNVDPKMVEVIMNEIMVRNPGVQFSDVAGLEFAKETIREYCLWPLLRPDLLTGLRSMPKGLLLFGPPGTGKTLIGKCIASQGKATFFSISASTLTSKWIGEGEKMVRALFAVARTHLPSVVFIDEVDSLLSQRSDTEHEASRRIKTEFLIQLDGASTDNNEALLIVGATNRPQELDEAARRRLVKRIYIPLPDDDARLQLLKNLLRTCRTNLTQEQIQKICNRTKGYSGADMTNLCKEAAFYPLRECTDIAAADESTLRPVSIKDFGKAFRVVRASVSSEDLKGYEEFDKAYGSRGFHDDHDDDASEFDE